MIDVFFSRQTKELDKIAINNYKIPEIVLMENAALGMFKDLYDKGESFLIFCGKGNNGGDALALARHLKAEGKKVQVYIVSNRKNYTESFKVNLEILENMSSEKNDIQYISNEEDINEEISDEIRSYDVIVDGLFGVGLNRDVTSIFKSVIELINNNGKFIVSIDTPSGLDCDLGIMRNIAVKADITYTFESIKRGFLNYTALDCIGNLKLIKLGISKKIKTELLNNTFILEEREYTSMIPKKKIYSHKGDFGRAVIVAGSKGYTGAAYIATEATVRSGAGLTTLLCKEEIQPILSSKLIEAMTLSLKSENKMNIIKSASSIAFGPGIGTGEYELDILEEVVKHSQCPIVIDADGITILAKKKEILNKLSGRCIITPHPGEMARFLGVTIDEVESDRIELARKVAKEYNIVVLLKGYNTVISDGTNTYINRTGNSKMASGGMGDTLTGIITSFIAQGMTVLNSALLGAYIHGIIGDELSKESYVINARDIIQELPKKINEIVIGK